MTFLKNYQLIQMNRERRKFIKELSAGVAAFSLSGAIPLLAAPERKKELFFNISLAQWSLHKSFFGKTLEGGFGALFQALQTDPDSALQGEIQPIDFPAIARQEYGIDTIELVNTFYFGKAKDKKFWKEFKNRADQEGVAIGLIMCDMEGNLGDADAAARKKAVQNHHKWVKVAKYLGAQTIRVNAAGGGSADEVKAAAVDGLGQLAEYGEKHKINVVVENHGSYSSNGKWLSDVISQVDSPYCGTLPDFGNFCIKGYPGNCQESYDRYQGVKELMPFAKGVSAKTHEFDEAGNEVHTDFRKMLKIVKDAGFSGNIGIEYEGQNLSEKEGILATKRLLEKVGAEIS